MSDNLFHRHDGSSHPVDGFNNGNSSFPSDNDDKKRKGIEGANLVRLCQDSFTNSALDASTTGTTALSLFSSVASAVSSGSAAIYLSVLASCSAGIAFLSNTASVNNNFAEAKKERLEMRLGLLQNQLGTLKSRHEFKKALTPTDTKGINDLENEINDLERKMKALERKMKALEREEIEQGQVS